MCEQEASSEAICEESLRGPMFIVEISSSDTKSCDGEFINQEDIDSEESSHLWTSLLLQILPQICSLTHATFQIKFLSSSMTYKIQRQIFLRKSE